MTDLGADKKDDERIRAAAAAWVVQLDRNPSRSRRDLDRWLMADPRHAAAYRRVAGRFDDARVLRGSQTYAARPGPIRRRHPVMVVGAFAIMVLAAILILPFLFRSSQRDRLEDRPVASTGLDQDDVTSRMTTGPSGIKSVGLTDGSVVTLDNGSVVETAFTPTSRHLTLVQGRARFTVAHDGRPFMVLAGGGSVLARGTVFDVSLAPSGSVGVSLLQGIVDVTPTASSAGVPVIRRLQQGERINYSAGVVMRQRPANGAKDIPWIAGAFEFDNVPLNYVLAAADRGAGPSIALGDPSLAGLRVSGRFDTSDRNRLAKNLARLFDLHIDVANNAIELRPR